MLDTIESAIEDIKQGKLVIVVDDEDRENEGDFITAARNVTPEVINFMSKYGRGLICAPLIEERCDELGLELRAKNGGVLRRTGHTEATIDLVRLAGFDPPYGGVLVEIMNEDGTMARLPQLKEIAKKFDFKLISIKDLIEYRLKTDSLIEEIVRVDMPTRYGHFKLVAFKEKNTSNEHLALMKGEWEKDEPVLVRVHSSCFTGDILGSLRCDCGEQLHKAMQMVEAKGKGLILYMNQEGRGIGLVNRLQENGMDTVEANLHLGFPMDKRDYGVGAQILRYLGVSKISLLSNNPKKRAGLSGYGLEIIETIPIEIIPNPHNEKYLRTKRDKLGHEILK